MPGVTFGLTKNDAVNSSPQHGSFLCAQLQSWEKPDEVALLYTGVLAVTLNRTIEVLFVPNTRKTERIWPPVLPDNTNAIHTPEEARLVSLALARYAVTPDAAQAGREELLPDPGWDRPEEGLHIPPSQGAIFYTTPQEYEGLSDEVLLLANRASNFSRGASSSELAGTCLMEFLLRRVIASPHFASKDRRLLGG